MLPLSRIARRAFGVPGMPERLSLPAKRHDNERLLSVKRPIEVGGGGSAVSELPVTPVVNVA